MVFQNLVNTNHTGPYQQVIIEDEKHALCTFVDGIISTVHPGYSNDGTTVLQTSSGKDCPHPAKKSPLDVEDRHQDYIDCVAATQIHKCRPNHCLKLDPKNCQICRFKFPKPLSATTDIIADEANGELEVVTKRNHSFVNNYNKLALQTWRANMDIQMITSSSKLKRYATKMIGYSTKAEPASKQSKEIFDAVAKNPTKDEAHLVNAVLMKAVGGRDYGAQEVCTLLSGEPLVTTSREFVTVSLNQKRELREVVNPREEVTLANIVDLYTRRPEELEEVSLFDYASSYSVKNKNPENVSKRAKNAICMHFPFHVNDPTSEHYDEYCRTQMLLHVPFRHESNLKNHEDTWVAAYENSAIYRKNEPVDLKNGERESDSEEAQAAEVAPDWALLCDDKNNPYEVRVLSLQNFHEMIIIFTE